MLKSVVLPAPLGPITLCKVPARTSRFTFAATLCLAGLVAVDEHDVDLAAQPLGCIVDASIRKCRLERCAFLCSIDFARNATKSTKVVSSNDNLQWYRHQ
jgi:hypothetical protein